MRSGSVGSSGSAGARAIKWGVLAFALALPILTLVPLGSYWLWEKGWVVYWAVFACATTFIAWIVQWRMLRGVGADRSTTHPETAGGGDPDYREAQGEARWTPGEKRAWDEVGRIAKTTDPASIKTREDVARLGLLTIETVAKSLHPERKSALLQFTAPEALALVERVAGRMNSFIRQNVPLGDRLTIAQLSALYEWRGTVELAEQAWSAWRFIRMLNPGAAVANEVRERISKELMAWGKSHVSRRLAQVYIEEVGRAAIDLYGGRLRIAPDRLDTHVTRGSRDDLQSIGTVATEPLRVLVAGQVSAGKSSLVNALGAEVRAAVDALPATSEFTPYRLDRDGLPTALIVDSPGLDAAGVGGAFIEQVNRSDLVLWVVRANRADRDVDRTALAALRQHFAAQPERQPPPILIVLTHIDQLRPFLEWRPPYDLTDVTSEKARSIRIGVETTAQELDIRIDSVIPCRLAPDQERYNVDAIWATIVSRLPDAQRAQLVRKLRDAEGAWDLGRVWGQVLSGGRVLANSLRSTK